MYRAGIERAGTPAVIVLPWGMHPYEKLTAWQKAHEFTVAALQVIGRRGSVDHQGLRNQLRRAAISVSANIVEGSSRSTAAQFASFLSTALGSAREAGYLIRLAADLDVISQSDRAVLEARCDQVCRMIVPLMRHVVGAPSRRTRAARASRASRASVLLPQAISLSRVSCRSLRVLPRSHRPAASCAGRPQGS